MTVKYISGFGSPRSISSANAFSITAPAKVGAVSSKPNIPTDAYEILEEIERANLPAIAIATPFPGITEFNEGVAIWYAFNQAGVTVPESGYITAQNILDIIEKKYKNSVDSTKLETFKSETKNTLNRGILTVQKAQFDLDPGPGTVTLGEVVDPRPPSQNLSAPVSDRTR